MFLCCLFLHTVGRHFNCFSCLSVCAQRAALNKCLKANALSIYPSYQSIVAHCLMHVSSFHYQSFAILGMHQSQHALDVHTRTIAYAHLWATTKAAEIYMNIEKKNNKIENGRSINHYDRREPHTVIQFFIHILAIFLWWIHCGMFSAFATIIFSTNLSLLHSVYCIMFTGRSLVTAAHAFFARG